MKTLVLLGWTLASAQPVGDVATTVQDPNDRQAALCVPALSARAGGEVASISVSGAKRSGSRADLRGEMNVLQRPPPPPPGEMAPPHVINTRFAYRCWLDGSRVVRVQIRPLRN
jgi:hypothetical protein